MKLITEVTEDIRYINEEKDGSKSLYIEGVFLQGGIKNRNGRIYPVEVLAKEVQRYTEAYVDKKRAFGELGHPDSPSINLDRVSHMIHSIRQEGSNFIGKAKILDTPMGRIVKNFIDEGACIGVSSRGMGSLKLNKEGIHEVQNDFYLSTAADIVADPSAPDAFVNGIMEGVEWCWENNQLIARKAQLAIEKAVSSRDLEKQKLQILENYLTDLSRISFNK